MLDGMREFPVMKDDRVKKIIKIDKGNGQFRTIYIPNHLFKKVLRSILNNDPTISDYTFPSHVKGFIRGRGIISNAKVHLSKAYTLNFDIADFFGSVSLKWHTNLNKIPPEILKLALVGEVLPQGFPTSPFLANIAAESLDKAIFNVLSKAEEKGITYTRYADDLCFSFNKLETANLLKGRIPQAASMSHFRLNLQKTTLQAAKGGRRIITGVAIDDELHIPRRIKRKMRAVVFNERRASEEGRKEQMNLIASGQRLRRSSYSSVAHFNNSFNGYLGFAKLTDSEAGRMNEDVNAIPPEIRHNQAIKFLREYNYDLVCYVCENPKKWIQEYSEKISGGNRLIITNDPVYLAGMSTFAVTWTSCMDIAGMGSYSKGIWFWICHPGVSLAMITGKRMIFRGGQYRPQILARTLLYYLDSGKIVHGRVYPGNSMAFFLSKILAENLGIEFISHEDIGSKIKGYVAQSAYLPYFDNTNIKTVTLKGKSGHFYRLEIGVNGKIGEKY